jgi:hypothetical protein
LHHPKMLPDMDHIHPYEPAQEQLYTCYHWMERVT